MSGGDAGDDAGLGVEDVLITPELARRPPRTPDHAAENRALGALAREMATSPGTVLQRLTDLMVELGWAQSAGISILEPHDPATFRWHAVSGLWGEHVGGTMPVGASPCGVVVARDAPLLFARPHEHFPAAKVEPLIREILLVPFHVACQPTGTLWVIAHDDERRFDAEDLRVLTSLGRFAAAAHQLTGALAEAERGRAELERRVGERTAALTRANERLGESEERQAFLLKLADALRRLADPVAVQNEAARVLGKHLGADHASYAEVDADGLHFTVRRDYTDGVSSFAGRYLFASFAPALVAGLRTGRTVTVANAERDVWLSEAERAACAACMVRAAAAVPLVKDGRLAAVLFLHFPVPHEWTADQVALVEETAERTWAAVERAKAEAALRESETALAADLANAELLRGLAERLVTEENAETIYDEILSAAMDVARSDAGTIQIYDPQTRSLKIIASRNFSRTINDYFHCVDAGSRTACGIALNTGHRAFVDFPDEVADRGCLLLVDEGLQSALAVPLVSRTGTPVGMLNTHWREARHRPTERQLRFLDLIARQAADLIEQRQAQGVLRESEARLRTLVEGLPPQPVWRSDGEGRWSWASPQWSTYTGRAEGSGDGHAWLDAVHSADRAAVLEAWREARNGDRYRADHRLWHASEGRYRWVQSHALPVRNGSQPRPPAGGSAEWIGTTTDVEELRRAQEQRILIEELHHRGRNLLAVVSGVAEQTLASSGSLEEFGRSFTQRLAALGRVQGLLSRDVAPKVTLEDLVRLELAAHGVNDTSDRVTLRGPKVVLPASTVQLLALALHELTTNALKHGALRPRGGKLDVAWAVDGATEVREMRLNWVESGVAMLDGGPTSHRGFGLDLLEQFLPYELDGETQIEFTPNGLHCSIRLPLDNEVGGA